jgi:hypothetical protein
MNKTIKKYLVVVLFLLTPLAIWIAGFQWFVHSESWESIRTELRTREEIKDLGEKNKISVSPFWLTYKFSGAWGKASIPITVNSENGQIDYYVLAERTDNKWKITSLRQE